MSEQEMRNKIDFIAEQTAQNTIQLQQLMEIQAQTGERLSQVDGLAPRVGSFETALIAVIGLIGDLTKRMNTLADVVGELKEQVGALTERVDALITLMVKQTLGEQGGDVNNENN